jgi:NitT/TauT family transport system substrate-binding protein
MQARLSRRAFVGATAGAGLGVVALSLAGCGGSSAKPTAKIRYGDITSPSSFPITIAQQRGYHAKQGIEVEKVPYAGLDAVANAFRAKEVDGGVGGIATIVKLHSDGVPVQVVFGSVIFTNDMLVLNDSPIRRYEDLKGKKIGVFGGAAGASANLFRAVCQAYFGFDPAKDANVQYGAGPLLGALVEKGELDAFLSLDPIAATMLVGGKVRSIGDIGDIYQERTGEAPFSGCINFMESYTEKNQAAVQAFLATFVEGVKYLRANPEAWIELGKSLGVEDPRAANLVRDRTVNRLNIEWNDEVVARQIRVMEFIQKYTGEDFLETIDRTALTTKYVPRSG